MIWPVVPRDNRSVLPAVQHGSGVGEADEHVLSAVQPVQLVPYVVRGHGGGVGGRTVLNLKRKTAAIIMRSLSHSNPPPPSFLLSLFHRNRLFCRGGARNLRLTKSKGEDFFKWAGGRGRASVGLAADASVGTRQPRRPRSLLVAVRPQGD